MVINNFDIIRMVVLPVEAYPPLIVNFEFTSAADIVMNTPEVMLEIICGDDLPPDAESLGNKWFNS